MRFGYRWLCSQCKSAYNRPDMTRIWIFSETLINIHELTQSRRQGGRQARYNTVVSLMSEYSLTRPRDVAADLSEQFQSSLWIFSRRVWRRVRMKRGQRLARRCRPGSRCCCYGACHWPRRAAAAGAAGTPCMTILHICEISSALHSRPRVTTDTAHPKPQFKCISTTRATRQNARSHLW